MRRIAAIAAVSAAALAGSALGAAPASAVTTTGWATWGPLTGTSNNFATTMQLPAQGFPQATVATDSRAPVQIPSGASTFLGSSTPVGAKYGSSKGHAYLNLRPMADTPTAPSTTTYTFDTPTPASGWAFVLGDVDADQVQISAKDATGQPVPASSIDAWFRGVFNYAGETDVPQWQPATATLVGNAAAADTNGASGWFEPNRQLSTLTFTYTRRAGFPVYQTWFASQAHTISGTVTPGTCTGEAQLTLFGPDGEQLASVPAGPGGTYSFGQYAEQGYTVSVAAPAGCAVVGNVQVPASTISGDATADFTLRAIVPNAVSGTVTAGGTPVAGATIVLHGPGGTITTVTDADGHYLIDGNPAAQYTVEVIAPQGYTGTATKPADLSAGSQVVDFTLVAEPSVSGTVTGGGDPLGGATVTLTPAGGPATTTVTRGDGTYDFPHVPAGSYQIAVTPPPGYRAVPPRSATVGTADVTGQDFALDRPGALGGHVASTTGTPIAGATVTVRGPGGARTLTTDAGGDYFLGDLGAGAYQITLTVPGGYAAASATTRSVSITAAGEIRGGQDFVVTAVAPSTPPPGNPPSATMPSGSGGETLANTGAPVAGPLVLGGGLLALGLLLLLAGGVRRTRGRQG